MFAFLAPYRCIILGGISFVLLAGASTPVSAQPARVKRPVPDAAAQNKALALVREVYRDDFVGAKSDEEKLALAQSMIDDAAAIQANGADAFVMLRVARNIALRAGSVSVASSAIDLLDTRYAIDELDMKAEAALGVAENAKGKEDREAAAEFTVKLVDRMIAADRFKRAAQLAVTATDVARRASEFALVRRLVDKRKMAESLAAKFEKVETAVATLEQQPDDPAANEIVGRYKCLSKAPFHVIIPMRKDQLNAYWDQGKVGWNGRCNKMWEGYHLGIFFTERTDIVGTVHVGSHNQGWGFGHVHHGEAQGYTWQGKRIPQAVFEIAVKTDELTKDEARFLLR